MRSYHAPEARIDSMIAEAERQKVKPADDAELKATRYQLALHFKALVARDIWDMDEYFCIVNEESHIVRKSRAADDGKGLIPFFFKNTGVKNSGVRS